MTCVLPAPRRSSQHPTTPKGPEMAKYYPVSAAVDHAARYGERVIEALPDNWRPRDMGFPSDWVADPATGVVMTPAKFDELAAERRSYGEELRRTQLGAARDAVRELEAEVRRVRALRDGLFDELFKADRDDAVLVGGLCHRIAGTVQVLAQVRASLTSQRGTIEELRAKAR